MSAIRGEDFLNKGLVIEPLDNPQSIQGATYDFRIGNQILLWSSYPSIYNPEEQNIYISPGDVAIIKTYESVTTPANIAGLVSAMVAFQAIGLDVSSTTIDPKFSGHLFVTVFNHGRFHVPLKYKDDLCSVTFFLVNNNTRIHHKRTQDFRELLDVFATKLRILLSEESPPKPAIPDDPVKVFLSKEYFLRDTFLLLKHSIESLDRDRQKAFNEIARLKSMLAFSRVFLKMFPWMIVTTGMALFYAITSPTTDTFVTVSSIASILSFLFNLFDEKLLRLFMKSNVL